MAIDPAADLGGLDPDDQGEFPPDAPEDEEGPIDVGPEAVSDE
jgi:hypothetical protein